MMRTTIALFLALLSNTPAWAEPIQLTMTEGSGLIITASLNAGFTLGNEVAVFHGAPIGPTFAPDRFSSDAVDGRFLTFREGFYDYGSTFNYQGVTHKYTAQSPLGGDTLGAPFTTFTSPGVPLIAGEYRIPLHVEVQFHTFANLLPTQDYELVADGTLALTLREHPFVPEGWVLHQESLTFSPVQTPEPATGVLLATGLILALIWRKFHRATA